MPPSSEESLEPTASTADGVTPRARVPTLPPGTCVGRYVLLAELGIGGMGIVYKAYDPQLERPVALKLLRAVGDDEASARFRERLLREAQALAQLSHPNVVAVHDVGAFGDGVFIAMEFVEGQTLGVWLKAQSRRPEQILELFLAAGRGLAAAHRAGMVHRDFKPDNVLVGDDGRVRVLDFGLAREIAAEPPPPAGEARPLAPDLDVATVELQPATVQQRRVAPASPPSGSDSAAVSSSSTFDGSRTTRLLASPLTLAGAILGTPRFMAPEQHLGTAVDARADQFSFSVALYHALCGRFPFDGKTLEEFRDNVVHGRLVPWPQEAHVPRWLRQLLVRGLAAAPASRFASMDALLAVLERSTERNRMRRVAFAVGLALTASLVLWSVLGWRARALQRAELCQGGPRRLAGIWDDAAQQRVRAGLLGTKRSYSADVWKTVATTLDRYAARWTAMHKDNCEATRFRGEQTDTVMTARMVCLDRKLQGMSSLVDVLAQADATVLDKAASAAAGLGSLEVCADVPALLAEVPPPSEPEMRERVAAIRLDLSRVEALRLAGKATDALPLADKATNEARKTGHQPILAEALSLQGRTLSATDPGRAADLLTEAFWAAYSNHLDRVAVVSATFAMSAHAMVLHFDQAALWEKYAEAGIRRMGGDDELEADLWSSRFMRANEQGRGDEQLQAISRAARLNERRFGFDDQRTINKQQNELTALTNSGRPLDAWKRRGALLERQQRLLGPRHPVVGRALMDLGDDEVTIGHLADARIHLDLSEQALRDAGMKTSIGWTAMRTYQIRLAVAAGRMEDVPVLAKETLGILESMRRGDSDIALSVRMLVAISKAHRGQVAEAVQELKRALQDGERGHGKDYDGLADLHGALADVYLRAGQFALSREEADRELALQLRSGNDASLSVAQARMRIARAMLAQGHAAEALALAEKNEPLLLSALGDQAPPLAHARRTRGDALLALGRREEAAQALQSALAVAERAAIDVAERQAIAAALERALTAHEATARR